MRVLLWSIIVAFAAWSGWWWLASSTAEKTAQQVFRDAQAAGFRAEHGGISVAGFPNRVDLTVTQPDLATPSGDWGWRAPFAQLFTLTYKPWHLIAALPNSQELLTPMGPITITSQKLQASAVFAPSLELLLNRANVVGEKLALTTSFGQLSAEQTNFASRPLTETGDAHEIALEMVGIALPEAIQARLPAAVFAPGTARLRVDAKLALSHPLNRAALASNLQLRSLDVTNATLSWGAAQVSVMGVLTPDAQGYAQGKLEVSLNGAPQVLDALQAGQILPMDRINQLRMIFTMLGGGGNTVKLPLTLDKGRMSLGPVVLGQAPRFHR